MINFYDWLSTVKLDLTIERYSDGNWQVMIGYLGSTKVIHKHLSVFPIGKGSTQEEAINCLIENIHGKKIQVLRKIPCKYPDLISLPDYEWITFEVPQVLVI